MEKTTEFTNESIMQETCVLHIHLRKLVLQPTYLVRNTGYFNVNRTKIYVYKNNKNNTDVIIPLFPIRKRHNKKHQ